MWCQPGRNPCSAPKPETVARPGRATAAGEIRRQSMIACRIDVFEVAARGTVRLLQHEDAGEFLGRVGPGHCPRRAAPAECPRAARTVRRDRVENHRDGIAEAHPLGPLRGAGVQVAHVIAGHHRDGTWAEQTATEEFAAVRQHLLEVEIVPRRAPQAAGGRLTVPLRHVDTPDDDPSRQL